MQFVANLSQFSSPFVANNLYFSKSVQQTQPSREGVRSVLVIDDYPDIALMIVALLKRSGYEAVAVFSAKEALDVINQKKFDLVISDIGMPLMDGYELARRLRSNKDYVSTPMIAITGFSEYADQQNAFNAGFDAHLQKPIDLTKLLKVMGLLGS